MRVYKGKLDTNTHYPTENEVIILATNGGFRQGSTAVISGQFTKAANGTPKSNFSIAGTITKLANDKIELFVGEDQYYWFVGTVSGDKITLTMKSPELDDYGKAELSLFYSET
ncbi:hypothetical protein N7519_004140 [Penicillium mononematosum]|uniref:uncharacterized protein n=1 Tax=Penicillium mononematosum TaxID=268346 RepID=UPI002547FDD9|nr:uncharacterized protein N7519_004140 [Penicillium mononematosum]KAJ6189232.1 hypothetical protein N7519_004140 [Penicillium mononematosum]